MPITHVAFPRWISMLILCRKKSDDLSRPVARSIRRPMSDRNILAAGRQLRTVSNPTGWTVKQWTGKNYENYKRSRVRRVAWSQSSLKPVRGLVLDPTHVLTATDSKNKMILRGLATSLSVIFGNALTVANIKYLNMAARIATDIRATL